MTLLSQNWCFHLVSTSFLETAWLFSSWALLRNAWAVMTFLKICSFFFDSNRHLMRNKLNASENYSVWMTERNWRATPHLCCQRELLFPFMWLNPSASKISQRFPSHVAHNHPAEQTGTLHQTDAHPACPPFGCLQPGFCGRHLLCYQLWEVFFFTAAMFLRFLCCSGQLGWNCCLYGTLLLYSWPHRGCRTIVLPWVMKGSWKPD